MDLNQFMVALLRADETGATKQHHRVKDHGPGSSSGAAAAVAGGQDDAGNREELHTAFHVFDANSDGFIDASELRSTMRELTGDTLTDDDVDAMIRSADRDGDGRINYDGTLRSVFVPSAGITELSRLLSEVQILSVLFCSGLFHLLPFFFTYFSSLIYFLTYLYLFHSEQARPVSRLEVVRGDETWAFKLFQFLRFLTVFLFYNILLF